MPPKLPHVLFAATCLIVGVLLVWLSERQPIAGDTLGYSYAAAQFASGKQFTHSDPLNRDAGPFFYPHAFRHVTPESEQAILGYPTGTSFLLGSLSLVLGGAQRVWLAAAVITWLGLLATFWLGRRLLDSAWAALWAAWLLISTPIWWEFGTTTWSEPPSLLMMVGAIGAFYLSRSALESINLQQSIGWSLLAALCVGLALHIRYTNALLLVPALALYDLTHSDLRDLFNRYRLITWGLFAIVLVAVLSLNTALLGGPLNSIYSTPALGAYSTPYFSFDYAFGPSRFGGYSAPAIAQTLWTNFSIILLLVPLGWWLTRPKNTPLLAISPLAACTLYAIYAFTPAAHNARFLLPIFPLIALAAVVPLENWQPATSTRGRLFISLVLLGLIGVRLSSIIPERSAINENNTAAIESVLTWSDLLPADAVLISSTHNDLLTTTADFSVFNYRRTVYYFPNGDQDVEYAYQCIYHTLDTALALGRDIYFIDQDGPEIRALFAEYFTLSPTDTTPFVFQLTSNPNAAIPAPCQPRYAP